MTNTKYSADGWTPLVMRWQTGAVVLGFDDILYDFPSGMEFTFTHERRNGYYLPDNDTFGHTIMGWRLELAEYEDGPALRNIHIPSFHARSECPPNIVEHPMPRLIAGNC